MKAIVLLLLSTIAAHPLNFTFEGTITRSTITGVNQGDPFHLNIYVSPQMLAANDQSFSAFNWSAVAGDLQMASGSFWHDQSFSSGGQAGYFITWVMDAMGQWGFMGSTASLSELGGTFGATYRENPFSSGSFEALIAPANIELAQVGQGQGVPEAGTTAALLGLGLLGLVAVRAWTKATKKPDPKTSQA
jgi:hypothetical protein